jgi:PTH1 family peptidyl-tRNA hydrolase
MILIVGLGNPGRKYEKTRHNIGFQVIDELGFLNKKKVILAKTKTFMNLSGKAVKLLVSRYQLPLTNLWVVHDDIDLPLGKIRISKGRGAAGHKGVESIIKELGTKNFVRFRIGIKPKRKSANWRAERFVLQKFNKGEEKIVKEVIKKTAEAISFSLKGGFEKAMSKYNK